MARSKRKRIIKWSVSILVVIGLAFAVNRLWPFRDMLSAYMAGKRSYDPKTSMENLRHLSAALSMYLEGNDSYPPKDKWVDELSLYVHAADLSAEDQMKKFRRPGLADDEYGYAYNGQVSTLWSDEVEDPAHTAVIYDSTKTHRNAYDDGPLESHLGGANAPVVFADGHLGTVEEASGQDPD